MNQTSAPAPSGHLAYSDYAQGAAILTGTIGASAFVLGMPHGETITGVALLATTALAALSQFLYSKGD